MSRSRVAFCLSVAIPVMAFSGWLMLRRTTGTAHVPSFTSLAVLPFEALAEDANQQHLADGLSLDLLRRLRILGAVQSSSRAEVLTWQETDTPPHHLARKLGAEILIAGTVSLEAGRISLLLEIEDARDKSSIARTELRGSQERIFDLQRQTARAVVESLKIPVHSSEKTRFQQDPSRSLKAWDYFLHGQGYLEERANPRGPVFAEDLYRRAIQLDPDFAQAHVGLSEALWLLATREEHPENLLQAELEARSALAIHPKSSSAAVVLAKLLQAGDSSAVKRSPAIPEILQLAKPDEATREVAIGMLQIGKLELAEAAWRSATEIGRELWLNWYVLGQFLQRGGRFREAEVAFAEAAARTSPGMTWPVENLTRLKLISGDLAGAVEVFETLDQDLVDIDTSRQIAGAYSFLGQLEAAVHLYRKVVESAPQDPLLHQELGDVLARLELHEQARGEYNQGLILVERTLGTSPSDPNLQLRLAVLASKAQDCSRALPLAATLRRHLSETADTYRDLAIVFALCANTEMAIETLQAALRHGLAPEIVKSQPEFQGLHSEAAFQALFADTVGVPPSP